VEKYNIRHFFFVDDVLTLSNSIMDVCDLIIEKKLKITFEKAYPVVPG
jgi:hypothetical protein